MTTDPCLRADEAPLLSLDDARERLVNAIQPITGGESVSLEHARGRVLAEDLVSVMDSPPFANAAMDGYAVRSTDTAEAGRTAVSLRVVGSSWAGRPYRGQLGAGQCVRIFTGAAIPEGSDAVLMQEEVRAAGDHITVGRTIAPDEYVRDRGRDLRIGQTALHRGKRLTPIDIGLAATLGIQEITVQRRLRVALLSSGDELRAPGTPLAYGEIHDSNRFALKAFLKALEVQVTDLGPVPDDAERLTARLEEASLSSDSVVTIGGASVGDADHLVPVLATLGEVGFWKVAIKPGKPFVYGRIRNTDVFGLPGNPVSAIVTFLQLVRPALLQRMGATPESILRLPARVTSRVRKPLGRMEFQRATFTAEASGSISVTALAGQDADRQSPLAAANCFLIVPADRDGFDTGDTAMIEPFCNYL